MQQLTWILTAMQDYLLRKGGFLFWFTTPCIIHIKSHICSYLIGNDAFMDLFLSEPVLGLRYIFVYSSFKKIRKYSDLNI